MQRGYAHRELIAREGRGLDAARAVAACVVDVAVDHRYQRAAGIARHREGRIAAQGGRGPRHIGNVVDHELRVVFPGNGGENLVLKKYIHIGVAVDTPNGLMVPVIRDVDQKGIVQLAKELGEVSAKARDLKITAADMQGGCFSISSLGGIGGTAFTPIINAPEVAILGVSKSSLKPVWQDGQFVPRLMLPLSLSYDHRVIDGAAGARFTSYLAQLLGDIRRVML